MLPAIPWLPWLPVTILIGVLVLVTGDLPADFDSRHVYVRTGFLVIALGLSFAFDDPAAPTTDAAPSPLRLRRAVRVALSLSLWGFLVLGLLWVAGIDPADPASIRGHLLLEASAVGAWGLAIASAIAKRWDEEPGRIASAALLAIYAPSWMVPERWKPWATPTDPRWDTGLAWWWVAFGVAVIITMVSSWDSRPWNLASAQKTRHAFVVGNRGSAA